MLGVSERSGGFRAPTATATAPRQPRYFIPVRLNPYTEYRTQQGLRNLIADRRLWNSAHLVVTAHPSVPDAPFENANLAPLSVTVVDRRGSRGQGTVLSCETVRRCPRFIDFRARLVEACVENFAFIEMVELVAARRAERSGVYLPSDRRRLAGTVYLGDELAISVYCTEMLGYWHEVWERPPPAGVIDPLADLYENYPYLVMSVCGTLRTKRRLSFLSGKATTRR